LDLFNNLWYDDSSPLEESQLLTSTLQPNGNRRAAFGHKAKQFWENTKRFEPLAKANIGTEIAAEQELRKNIEKQVASRGQAQADSLNVVPEGCEECEGGLHSLNGFPESVPEYLQQVHAAVLCEGHTGEVGPSCTWNTLTLFGPVITFLKDLH
jgi:hypothetical protein